jgi:antitoxin (DNA-binding transcriptional repressor) of toxin-antitoxin stability system
MNTLISAKELRASLPKVVAKVRRGARFTVLYRSRPAFQVVPVTAAPEAVGDLDHDSLYRAKPVGRSKDGRSSADHDAFLYGK